MFVLGVVLVGIFAAALIYLFEPMTPREDLYVTLATVAYGLILGIVVVAL